MKKESYTHVQLKQIINIFSLQDFSRELSNHPRLLYYTIIKLHRIGNYRKISSKQI